MIEQLAREDRILVRYCDKNGDVTDAANPNGSLENIAGICNEARNVLDPMPHPERASEELLGGEDRRRIFESGSLPVAFAVDVTWGARFVFIVALALQNSDHVLDHRRVAAQEDVRVGR